MKRLFLIALMVMILPFNLMAISEFDVLEPVGTDNISTGDQVLRVNAEALDRLLTNYKVGMGLTYTSATTITVALGDITVESSTGVLRFRSNPTTTTVTFSNIDTGVEAAGVYYVYAVGDNDTEAATFVFSVSASAPTGVTYYKKIGSFTNDSSKDITSTTVADTPLISVNGIPSSAVFQTGMIILWSGSEASIPSGWVICDGTNSTPDLTDTFVMGAGDSYAVDATGGTAAQTFALSSGSRAGILGINVTGYVKPNGSYMDVMAGGTAATRTVQLNTTTSKTILNPYYALCYIMKE